MKTTKLTSVDSSDFEQRVNRLESLVEELLKDVPVEEKIEVKMKELQTFAGGHQKGDWDVGIAMDIIKAMNKLDVVVLCSGDGDFVPLLEYLQMTGQLTETTAFGRSCSSKVKELTDNFIDLDENPRKFLMPIKTGRKQ